MSHVEPTPPTGAPSSPPPASDPPPPPASPPPPPHVPDPAHKSDSDRLSALESVTTNLAEAMTAFMEGIKGGNDQEQQPTKLPWTHRGGRK